jgi:hypothetical protein
MPAPTTFEADEPTCVNCNTWLEVGHCDNCKVCIDIQEQLSYEGSWICGPCLLEHRLITGFVPHEMTD